MKIYDFKRILQRISDLYSAAGATDAAKDVGHVIKALDSHDDMTVDDFVKAKTAKPDPAKKAGRSSPALNDKPVDEYASRLLDAGIDKNNFEAALLTLKSDRSVSKAELYAIANAYINRPSGGAHNFTFKSPNAAFEKINRIFVERMDAQSKHDTIEKMGHWPDAPSNPAQSKSPPRGL